MIVRDVRRLALFIGPAIAILYLCWKFFLGGNAVFSPDAGPDPARKVDSSPPDDQQSTSLSTHHEIFSASTPNGSYFRITFGASPSSSSSDAAINPNIIPHPLHDDAWVVVAQRRRDPAGPTVSSELVCYAAFVSDDELRCRDPPWTLPVAPTTGIACDGELAVLAMNVGPHDARVFLGPLSSSSFIVYGSNSRFACFGQWIQDFGQSLMGWVTVDGGDVRPVFAEGTEMQRPGGATYGRLEKNWFVFWDSSGGMYVHHGVSPRRSFARLDADGSAGEDLAPLAAGNDEGCMARYMPAVEPESESIHQATNSLSVTMCRRSDPSCLPDASNTFLFAVFQHKSHRDLRSVYEPYVMVFGQDPPFEIHAISKKPIWIHGRRGGTGTGNGEKVQTEMFYVVSMSWKMRSQRYHGYLDDVLFIAFGIEDKDAAGIDVVAGDLLGGLGLCSDS